MSQDPFAPLEGNQAGDKPTAEQKQTVVDTVKSQQERAAQESAQAQQQQTPSQTAPKTDEVPRGTRAEILDWVGTDKAKAKRALAAEKKADQPRKTLLSELEGVISG